MRCGMLVSKSIIDRAKIFLKIRLSMTLRDFDAEEQIRRASDHRDLGSGQAGRPVK